MMFDIDHFKTVNDIYGHAAGDQLLQALSARIRKTIRGSDIFCRLSGDEFVIVMPDTRLDVAAKAADRIRAGVAIEGFSLAASKKALSVTISVGLAESGEDAAELLRRADKGLYRSKQAGRNRVSVEAPPAPAIEPAPVVSSSWASRIEAGRERGTRKSGRRLSCATRFLSSIHAATALSRGGDCRYWRDISRSSTSADKVENLPAIVPIWRPS